MDSTGISQASPAPTSSPTPSGDIALGDVCDHAQRKEAYFLINGVMRLVYALPKEVRGQYIPPSSGDRLQNPRRSWTTRCFCLTTPGKVTNQYWQSISKAVEAVPVYFEELPVKGTEAECHAWKFKTLKNDERPTRGTPLIKLPPASEARGKELAIYNADKEKNCKISTAKGRIIGQLKPEEAILFHQSQSSDHSSDWQEMVSYKPEGIAVRSNPLLVEEQPIYLVKTSRSDRPLPEEPREGELFIPVKMVCETIARKRQNQEEPVVCSGPYNVQQLLKASQNKPALSFIFHDTRTEHLIAVRVVRDPDNNRVICYLNETLGSKLDTTGVIREKIIDGLKEGCRGQDIVVLYPQEELQKDYSSCGVFTINGMRFFDKHPDFDQEIRALAGDPKKTPEGKSSTQQDRVQCRPLLLKEMPPHLLKFYQGSLSQINNPPTREELKAMKAEQRDRLFTKAQLDAPVSGKGKNEEPLRAYIIRHQKELQKLSEPEARGFANMAAFRKRYKYLSQCLSLSHDRRCFSPERQAVISEAEIEDEPVLMPKRKTSAKGHERHGIEQARKSPLIPASGIPVPKERKAAKAAVNKLSGKGKITTQPAAGQPIDFSPILKEGDPNKINKWIRDRHPEIGEFPENEEDWCNICDFANFVADPNTIDLTKLQGIRTWAAALRAPEAQKLPRNQLILKWLNVSKNMKPYWQQKNLDWVLDRLEKLGEKVGRNQPPEIAAVEPQPKPMEMGKKPESLESGASENAAAPLSGRKRTSSQSALPEAAEARPAASKYLKLEGQIYKVQPLLFAMVKLLVKQPDCSHIVRWLDEEQGLFQMVNFEQLNNAWHIIQRIEPEELSPGKPLVVLCAQKMAEQTPLNSKFFPDGSCFVLDEDRSTFIPVTPVVEGSQE
ncbi:MAG: hypothetical protein ACR2PT_18595 [Endozoicomonas sp.]